MNDDCIEKYLRDEITKHSNVANRIWNERVLFLMEKLEISLKNSSYSNTSTICDVLIKSLLNIREASNNVNWLRDELSEKYKDKFSIGKIESE